MDLRIANDFALAGDMLAFIFDGERGISGDIAMVLAAIKANFSRQRKSLMLSYPP